MAIWTRLLRLVDARLACVRLDETHTVALVLEVGERSPAIVFALLFGAWNGAWTEVRLEREVRLGGVADPGDAVCSEQSLATAVRVSQSGKPQPTVGAAITERCVDDDCVLPLPRPVISSVATTATGTSAAER